ncbi:hypothetical protein NEHOM01_0380 [Nematocida homosporus]|uniref:uncharacterized protein n=1 Tax=Nematocida homosporus TaxID=1912981 RepID=UPI00221E7648|nr:uncharacterized protein NEHOM01_0380 [Nematocida homosporus]KAI5184778.1 hypothetical protein NEHOM01_0380 [Nematocida homosporus]
MGLTNSKIRLICKCGIVIIMGLIWLFLTYSSPTPKAPTYSPKPLSYIGAPGCELVTLPIIEPRLEPTNKEHLDQLYKKENIIPIRCSNTVSDDSSVSNISLTTKEKKSQIENTRKINYYVQPLIIHNTLKLAGETKLALIKEIEEGLSQVTLQDPFHFKLTPQSISDFSDCIELYIFFAAPNSIRWMFYHNTINELSRFTTEISTANQDLKCHGSPQTHAVQLSVALKRCSSAHAKRLQLAPFTKQRAIITKQLISYKSNLPNLSTQPAAYLTELLICCLDLITHYTHVNTATKSRIKRLFSQIHNHIQNLSINPTKQTLANYLAPFQYYNNQLIREINRCLVYIADLEAYVLSITSQRTLSHTILQRPITPAQHSKIYTIQPNTDPTKMIETILNALNHYNASITTYLLLAGNHPQRFNSTQFIR